MLVVVVVGVEDGPAALLPWSFPFAPLSLPPLSSDPPIDPTITRPTTATTISPARTLATGAQLIERVRPTGRVCLRVPGLMTDCGIGSCCSPSTVCRYSLSSASWSRPR